MYNPKDLFETERDYKAAQDRVAAVYKRLQERATRGPDGEVLIDYPGYLPDGGGRTFAIRWIHRGLWHTTKELYITMKTLQQLQYVIEILEQDDRFARAPIMDIKNYCLEDLK